MTSSSSQLGRRMLDGTMWNLLAQALLLPAGLLTTAFLTRHIGSEGYGLFILTATVISWVEWSVTSVFARATIKLVSEAEDWQSVGTTVLRLHLWTSIGAVLLLWLLAAPIAGFLKEPVLAGYIRLYALNIPLFSLASAHQNILVGLGSFRQQAFAIASRTIAKPLVIILLVGLGLSVSGAILGTVAASLVNLAVSRFSVRPSLLRPSTVPARQLWSYASLLFLSALSMNLYDKLDLVALKVLGGTAAQAGFYGAAQNLALMMSLFAMSFSPPLLATLGRMLRAGDDPSARKLSRDAMRAVLVLIPFVGMTAGATSEITRLILGSEFLPAAPLLALMLFGGLGLVMFSVTTTILIAAGKPAWPFALAGPLVPLSIVGYVLCIPRWGTTGACIVATVCDGLGALVGIVAVHHLWRVLPPLGTLWRNVAVCGLAYALAALWPAPGLWLVLKLAAIGLVIPLALLLLGEFSASDMTLLRSMLRRRPVPEPT